MWPFQDEPAEAASGLALSCSHLECHRSFSSKNLSLLLYFILSSSRREHDGNLGALKADFKEPKTTWGPGGAEVAGSVRRGLGGGSGTVSVSTKCLGRSPPPSPKGGVARVQHGPAASPDAPFESWSLDPLPVSVAVGAHLKHDGSAHSCFSDCPEYVAQLLLPKPRLLENGKKKKKKVSC